MASKLAVFIGRFSPLHIGHINIIKTALEQFDRVAILIGSSFQPRTTKNPWTVQERMNLIRDAFASDPEKSSRIILQPIRDKKYNNTWWASLVHQHVGEIVTNLALSGINISEVRLIGHEKDDSSWYVHTFPQWGAPVLLPAKENLSATDIRNMLFNDHNLRYLSGVVPHNVLNFISEFKTTKEYADLHKEYHVLERGKQAWAGAPYPPIFVTVDAMVIHPSGRIIMGNRLSYPGKGLLALPGGFLEQNESIVDGAIRELQEETRIKLAPAALRGSIKKVHVFDDPARSARGRTITHTHLFMLPDGPLPRIRGSDDMTNAHWLNLHEIREDMVFEDHYHQIQFMTGNYADAESE